MTKQSVTKPNNDLITKFKPIVQGVWVKKDYIDKINKTKSPEASSDLATDMTTFYVDISKVKGDSLLVNAGWGNHDGSDIMLYFRSGTKTNTIVLAGGDLSYEITGKDTVLSLHKTNKGTTTITKYIRAATNETNGNLGDGMDYLVNKALVNGNYLFTDSTGINHEVKFGSHGELAGFFNFHKYSINVDLNSDAMDNLDEIGFDFDQVGHKSFSFKIIKDTLALYNTYPNPDSTELILGKRLYKLVRTKPNVIPTR